MHARITRESRSIIGPRVAYARIYHVSLRRHPGQSASPVRFPVSRLPVSVLHVTDRPSVAYRGGPGTHDPIARSCRLTFLQRVVHVRVNLRLSLSLFLSSISRRQFQPRVNPGMYKRKLRKNPAMYSAGQKYWHNAVTIIKRSTYL